MMKKAAILILMISLNNFSEAKYSGGAGIGENPYQISNVADLLLLRDSTEDYSKHFILTADIDLADNIFSNAVIAYNIGGQWSHQFYGARFSGVFDGDNHEIKNLTITTDDDRGFLGLFGCIYGNNSKVINLAVENASITGSGGGGYAGALCGELIGGSSISNCFSSGSIDFREQGGANIGGLCGNNEAIILQSGSMVTTIGTGAIGGFCGYNRGRITECYAKGAVDSRSRSGGFCGKNYGSIKWCYSTGSIYAHSTGNSVVSDIGGFCGYMEKYSSSTYIIGCYASGTVTVEANSQRNIGGFIGFYATGYIQSCYYYVWASLYNGYGTPLGTEEMTQESSYLSGYHFTSAGSWAFHDSGLPTLIWEIGAANPLPETGKPETILQGDGTLSSPFQINSTENFEEFCRNEQLDRGYYLLKTDVDLSGNIYSESVINRSFFGLFDGGGHVISNMTIVYNDSLNVYGLGLFSRIYGDVKRIGVESFLIQADNSLSYGLGGICGYNYGVVENCYARGRISGHSYAGGVCGSNSKPAGGYNSTGGQQWAANRAVIINSYATVHIQVNDIKGGICAASSGDVQNSFWDLDVSETSSSAGGTGKTTLEMESKATFVDAGWDFDDIWVMGSYPELKKDFQENGTSFFDWIEKEDVPEHFKAEGDCPAGDNIPNLLKYGCGLRAMEYYQNRDLFTYSTDSSNSFFSIIYKKSKSANQVAVFPEHSTSLANNASWNTNDIHQLLIASDTSNETWEASISMSNLCGFLRLKAEKE